MTATVESGGWLATLAEAGTLPMRGSWLAPAGRLPDTVEVPSNVLLLRGHGRTILVDTAAGERAGEWPGAHADLSGVLAGADVSPEQVDAVLLTHLDFDHCGGIVQDGVPVFPRARVLVMRDAADWASDADDPGAEVVRTVAAAGLLDPVDPGEVAPGLTVAAAPGHRIGHSTLTFGGAAYLADTVHHAEHVAHPKWDREFDGDAAAALSTRLRLLDACAGRGPVACSHIAGWGRIELTPGGLRWRTL